MQLISNPLKICLACANGYFAECLQPIELEDNTTLVPCGLFAVVEVPSIAVGDEEVRLRGGQVKSYEDITDVQSTGRKRAAKLYPITEGMICEWAGLAKAGGGVLPSIGCVGNPASDIHHGCDKNTLNNEPGNVHRICAKCHNRWHASNDEFYGTRPTGTEPFIPLDGNKWSLHDPDTKATVEEIANNEMKYSIRKDRR